MVSKKLLAVIVVIVIIAGVAGYWYYQQLTAPKPVKISLYTKAGLWASFIEETGAIERFKQRMLSEKNLEVEVELITRPHKGYRDTLVADFAAGTVGDVVWVGAEEIPGLADAGLLLDLTPYVEKWDRWGQFYSAAKELVTYEGKVYAVPFETAPIVIFYRIDLFEQAGISVPWQPKNWEDIYEAAAKIKENLPDVTPINPMYSNELPILAAGGTMYDPADGKFIVKSDAVLAAFEYYYNIFHEYKLSPVELKLEKWDTRTLFKEAKLAITVDGVWCWAEKWGPGMPHEIPNRNEVVGYAMFPMEKGGGYISLTGAYTYAIYANTEHPDLAWELLKELVSPEYMAEWGYRTSHLVPAKDAVTGKYAEDPFLKWSEKVMEYTIPKPLVYGVKQYTDSLKTVIYDYLLPKATSPEECMDLFAEQVIDKLGEDKVKALPPYTLKG